MFHWDVFSTNRNCFSSPGGYESTYRCTGVLVHRYIYIYILLFVWVSCVSFEPSILVLCAISRQPTVEVKPSNSRN